MRQRADILDPRTHQDQQTASLHGRLAGSVVTLWCRRAKPCSVPRRCCGAIWPRRPPRRCFGPKPIDGVVLLGGCDKTIPSLLMAVASFYLPAVVVPGGPMLTGTFRGVPLGCGTDVWRLSEEVRAGTLSAEQFTRSESAMIRSREHCNTRGTASTMGRSRDRSVGRGDGRCRPTAERVPYAYFVHQRDGDDGRRRRFHQRRGLPTGDCRAARDRPHTDDSDRICSHVPLLVDLPARRAGS
jgi:hypothetical protein